jgi:hypothetical protein
VAMIMRVRRPNVRSKAADMDQCDSETTGLGAMGLLGWRRKRKAQAIA